MTKKSIKEMAAVGSTGAGSIAVTPNRMGKVTKRDTLKDFLTKWSNSVKNRMVMKPVAAPVKEFYDLSDVVSRLKSIEGTDKKKSDVVIYGVEDDEGNIMKISVRKDQSKDFEVRLANDMAEAKDNKLSGAKNNVSLAELLYNLKSEFEIVDVEFPKIPKDVIYNADKATYGPDTSEVGENDVVDDESMSPSGEMGEMDMEGGMEGDMGEMDMEGGMEGDDGEMTDMDSEESEDGEMPEDELEMDDESVEDFTEEEVNTTPESLLQSVMDMLKADAEAKKAQADAAAEEARARQAEYAYRAANATVAHEEEFAQMELEMEQQKQKEKEAKKLANLAKHKVTQGNTMRHKSFPMRESILGKVIKGFQLNELDDFDTVQSVSRAKMAMREKYKVKPDDSPDAIRYKQTMFNQVMRELNARLQAVKQRDRLNKEHGITADEEQALQQSQQNPQQRMNPRTPVPPVRGRI